MTKLKLFRGSGKDVKAHDVDADEETAEVAC